MLLLLDFFFTTTWDRICISFYSCSLFCLFHCIIRANFSSFLVPQSFLIVCIIASNRQSPSLYPQYSHTSVDTPLQQWPPLTLHPALPVIQSPAGMTGRSEMRQKLLKSSNSSESVWVCSSVSASPQPTLAAPVLASHQNCHHQHPARQRTDNPNWVIQQHSILLDVHCRAHSKRCSKAPRGWKHCCPWNQPPMKSTTQIHYQTSKCLFHVGHTEGAQVRCESQWEEDERNGVLRNSSSFPPLFS